MLSWCYSISFVSKDAQNRSLIYALHEGRWIAGKKGKIARSGSRSICFCEKKDYIDASFLTERSRNIRKKYT
jgi:fructose-1,6-bisphosphatase/inositol monophosphatase family enzyme